MAAYECGLQREHRRSRPHGISSVRRSCFSPFVNEFGIAKLSVLTSWIDSGGNPSPSSVTVIEVRCDALGRLPTGGEIDHRGHRSMAVAGASHIPEDLLVESTAAQVPEVLLRRELQPMNIGAEIEPFRWSIYNLDEAVSIVHQVVKRKVRINPGRRKHLEKCLMTLIERVRIATAVKVATTYPRGCFERFVLITSLERSGFRVLVERSPLAVL